MLLSRLDALLVDQWDAMIDVNVRGLLHGIAAVLPHFTASGRGHLITVASIGAPPGRGDLRGVLRHQVRRLGHDRGGCGWSPGRGVRVTTVSPGVVDSELAEHITDPHAAELMTTYRAASISADTIAGAISWAVGQPEDVDVNEIVVRPTPAAMNAAVLEQKEKPGVVVVLGAGPGVGTAVARRFARQGWAVGLVARDGERIARSAVDLRRSTGVDVTAATGDATDPDQVRRALDAVAADLGEPAVLCFCPLPDLALIRPVLETRPEELMASLQLNVAGAAAAVQSVLPGMQARGRGSLLFTTGSAGIDPDPARAASAVTTTAATVYLSLLRQALEGTEIRVGHTVVVGPIIPGGGQGHDPDDVAADLWSHHLGQAGGFPTVLHRPHHDRSTT